jgi:hypothetical protein
MKMMFARAVIAAALSLASLSAAHAQSSPGTSPEKVTRGGTGRATFAANCILYGAVTSPINCVTATANGVLTYNGSAVPVSSTTLPNAVQDNITRLGTVTSGTWNGTQIASAYIADAAVTYAKIQNVAALSLIGRSANSSGVSAAISASAASDCVFRESGSTIGCGTVATAGLADTAVSYAKLQNVAALSLIGRSANSSGVSAAISASAASDCVFRESGSTIGCGTVATAGIANDAVTYAKIQNISTTQRVLGRNTAGVGDTEEVAASSVLDWIGSTRGSILYRGASGWAIATPGTAGQVWTSNGSGADPTYQNATGGGGSLSDTDRRNILLERIYLAKLYTDPRRLISAYADGFKSTTGINTGSSSGYTADTTNGYLYNSASSALIADGTGTVLGNATAEGGNAAAFNGTTGCTAGSNCAAVATSNSGYNNYVGKDWGSGNTKTITRFIVYGPTDASMLGGTSTTCKLQGSIDNFSSSVVDLATTVSISGNASTTDTTSGITTTTAYRYHRVNCNGNGSAGLRFSEVRFYETSSPSNIVLLSTAQTADASVGNCRILLEFDPIDAITLNTDLTAECSTNGGTNYASMTLSSAGTTQGGRTVAETADTATTSGTSFIARIKTFNNKSIRIYGQSTTVH